MSSTCTVDQDVQPPTDVADDPALARLPTRLGIWMLWACGRAQRRRSAAAQDYGVHAQRRRAQHVAVDDPRLGVGAGSAPSSKILSEGSPRASSPTMLEPLVWSKALPDPASPSTSASAAPRWPLLAAFTTGIRAARLLDQELAVVQVPDHGLQPKPGDGIFAFGRPHERPYFVSDAGQAHGHRTADVATSARHEHVHVPQTPHACGPVGERGGGVAATSAASGNERHVRANPPARPSVRHRREPRRIGCRRGFTGRKKKAAAEAAPVS